MIMIGLLLISQVYGNWPMWGGEPTHQSVQLLKGAMTTAPVIRWTSSLPQREVEWQFSAIADVDNDGYAEVVLGASDGNYYCLRGTDGTEKWRFNVGNDLRASAAVADVDGDGAMEVVVASWNSSSGGGIYCLRGTDGTQKWSFATAGGIFGGATVADVDGDGQIEVVVGSWDGNVYCLRGTDGSEKWRFSTGGYVFSSPAVGDVDGDGAMEVVIGSNDNHVYCLEGMGGTEKWNFAAAGWVRSSPVIADVDGDGHMEVVAGSDDGRVYCLSGTDGAEKWNFNTGNRVWACLSVADCDRDGQMEVLTGDMVDLTFEGHVYCLNGTDGSLNWTYNTPSRVHTPGALVDIDGDDTLEFLVPQFASGGQDTLYCLNTRDGSPKWKLALAFDVHSPFAGDIDNDGCSEIITSTQESDGGGSRIFALDDAGDSSGCSPTYGDVNETNGSAALDFRVMGKGLYLFVPNQTQISLELYDASGRLVQNMFNGLVPPGGYNFIPNTQTKGVYLAVLRCQGKKIISLKLIR